MKHFIILLSLGLYARVLAQPTLNNAENFIIGTTLKFINCSTVNVSPGNTGTNQVWNYTSLSQTNDTITEWMVSPSSTPAASLFPSANLVEKYSDGRYVYVNKTTSSNLLVGFYDPSITVNYPTPIKFMKRPISFNDNVTDYFTTDYTINGYNFKGTGTVNIAADAFGTLMLPNNTYSNVLRVKISQLQVDTLLQFGTTYTTVSITYTWFDNNHTSALFKIDSVGSPSFNEKHVAYLLNETVSGIQELKKLEPLRIYPNPAREHIIIESKQGYKLSIYNSLGEKVLTKLIENQREVVSTINFKPGPYCVIIESQLGTHTGVLIVSE